LITIWSGAINCKEPRRIVDDDDVIGHKGSLDGEADGHLLVARVGNAVGIGDDKGNVGHLTPDDAS
jgi:hypothetical protein